MKPLDKRFFLIGAHHKAGTALLRQIMSSSFKVLGMHWNATNVAWVNHLSTKHLNRWYSEATEKGMEFRAVHIVRDPMAMIVSGYCYHHAGNEKGAKYAPPNITSLGPTEGIPVMATYMENVVAGMVEVASNNA